VTRKASLRILMLTQNYPPTQGGIELHVQALSRELEARGHEVAVATLWQPGLPEYAEEDGVRVYRIRGTAHRLARLLFENPACAFSPPVIDPELLRALGRVIALESPQVVHGHNWLVHQYLPLAAHSTARLVVTLHDYGLSCPRWTLLRSDGVCSGPALGKCIPCAAEQYGWAKGTVTVLGSRVMNAAERRAVDMFLPVSRSVADGTGLSGSGLPYQIVPNFVRESDAGADSAPAALLNQLPTGGYFLFVGAFGRHKGIDVLLRAHSSIDDAPPLVLIGYEISGYSLDTATLTDNVIILKEWPHAAVMEAWRRSTVGLIPSIMHDSFPTVALEAMTAGRPVIASRMGGIPDIVVDGETGILVPAGDVAALRVAMEQLWHDPARRAEMGEAALRRVAGLRAEVVVPAIEGVYEELLRDGSRGAN
jgi:glycosyltransferase involved in cell wall biosynthesis